MKQKLLFKNIKTAVGIGLLLLLGLSTFAQNDIPVICLSENQTTNLRNDPVIQQIINSIEAQVTQGTVGNIDFDEHRITFIEGTGDFSITPEGMVTNFRAGGMIHYRIEWKLNIDLSEENGGTGGGTWFNPCPDDNNLPKTIEIPGGNFESISINISGTFSGTLMLALNMPNDLRPIIQGANCFDTEIGLYVQPIFSNWTNEWRAYGGLTANVNNQNSVVFTRTENSTQNSYTITFTATDEVCSGNTVTDSVTVRERTQTPIIAPLPSYFVNNCIPIGTTTVEVSIADPRDGYEYIWFFNTSGRDSLQGTGNNNVSINIGNNSGFIFVLAVGPCGDTASSELLQINRELSDEVRLIASRTECVFLEDSIEFHINPTLQEEMVWGLPPNWPTVGAINTSSVLAFVQNPYTITIHSKACPAFSLSHFVDVTQLNLTVEIDGEECLVPGEPFEFTAYVRDVENFYGIDFFWTTSFGETSDGLVFVGNVSPTASGTEWVRLTATKCNRQFRDTLEVRFAPVQPSAITVSKDCINVGMEDILTVSVPAVAGVSYEWTATFCDGTSPTITPNGSSATIRIDNRAYGDILTIRVVAKNDCGNSVAQKKEMKVEGVGYNFVLYRQTTMPIRSILHIYGAPTPLSLGTISSLGWTNILDRIIWTLHGVEVSHPAPPNQPIFLGHSLPDPITATLVPRSVDGCRTKIISTQQ